MGADTPSRWVESPTSRLSYRITKWPRSANCWHISSGQASICIPRPITSSSGGSLLAPKVSYAISIPLTFAMPPSMAATV